MTRKLFSICLVIFFITTATAYSSDKIHYMLHNDPIDVIIPCTKKDLDTLDLCIDGIRKYGENIRRIIVVSSEKLTDNAEWFDEKKYPFNKRDLAFQIFPRRKDALKYIASPNNRLGWMYQQFLKLYAFYVIPNLSSNVLILDSDTIFLNPVSFINEYGEAMYNVTGEYHLPYFYHMARLLPGLKREFHEYSGIAHHMIFQKAVMDDLFKHIMKRHKEELWKAVCHCIDIQDIFACFSEYEIYFNFVFSRTDQMHIRPLSMINLNKVGDFDFYKGQGLHYVSCHAWMRE